MEMYESEDKVCHPSLKLPEVTLLFLSYFTVLWQLGISWSTTWIITINFSEKGFFYHYLIFCIFGILLVRTANIPIIRMRAVLRIPASICSLKFWKAAIRPKIITKIFPPYVVFVLICNFVKKTGSKNEFLLKSTFNRLSWVGTLSSRVGVK